MNGWIESLSLRVYDKGEFMAAQSCWPMKVTPPLLFKPFSPHSNPTTDLVR